MARKRKPRWMLLYRLEDGYRVYRYEPLWRNELNARKRDGWRLIS